jgi:ketosteroid isomerase-like protein
MNKILVAALTSSMVFLSCSQKTDYKRAEEYIRESEKQWAESVASGDTSVIKRILADDFIGVDPDGNHYNKQTMVQETAKAAQYFLSNHLNDVKIRFYDNFAIAQGDETWVKRADSSTARFVWTDTWIFRNDKWEILAAEDLIAPVKK